MSETALKNLSLKEDFITNLVGQCNSVKKDCVYSRLRVSYDYTKNERIDAVILTSKGIHLLEIITWTGRYRKESDTYWIREEKVDTSSVAPPPAPPTTDTSNGGPSPVTVMVTKVINPVINAVRKRKALVQYLESKLGARCVSESHISLHVLIVREECVLSEDCLSIPGVIPYSQLNVFYDLFRTGWGRWVAEWYPWWPVWISGYTKLKETLSAIPHWDILQLTSGSKLYGELRSCKGVPYDRESTCEIKFKTTKAGLIYGRNAVKAQAIKRDGTYLFTEEVSIDSVLEFLCVDADTTTVIKLTDIHNILISKPL